MWMAVAYRYYCVASIKVSIDLAVLVPKGCVESTYRLEIPKFIYFK